MKAALLATPFNTISKSMDSHRAAQGVIYADQLTEAGRGVHLCLSGNLYIKDWSKYDTLYVYHGNDWSGSLNLFGGLKNYGGIYNFVNFSNFKGKVISLVIDMPDYYNIMLDKITKAKEKGQEYNEEWDNIDWDNLKRICTTSEVLNPNELDPYPRLSIGDSHAISMYRPGWQNLSVPFKTLHGALKEGLDSFIKVKQNYETIEFYFGNIDVRHHLCRQEDPVKATQDLVKKYVDQAKDVAYKYGCNVVLYELLPIENESRSLPKTGYYKGKPFYGSWKERNEIRKLFKKSLYEQTAKTNGRVTVYEWIGEMINSKGELDFKCMEKPQSVHLSRNYYPHWQGYQWSMAPYREYIPTPENKKMTLEDFFA